MGFSEISLHDKMEAYTNGRADSSVKGLLCIVTQLIYTRFAHDTGRYCHLPLMCVSVYWYLQCSHRSIRLVGQEINKLRRLLSSYLEFACLSRRQLVSSTQ